MPSRVPSVGVIVVACFIDMGREFKVGGLGSEKGYVTHVLSQIGPFRSPTQYGKAVIQIVTTGKTPPNTASGAHGY